MCSSSARRRLSRSDASSSYNVVRVCLGLCTTCPCQRAGSVTLALRKKTPSFRILDDGQLKSWTQCRSRDLLFATELIYRSANIAEVDDVVKGPVGRV